MEMGLKENIVATIVDITSTLFAFVLGVHNSDFLYGLGYAALDAWLVIWQRNRITHWVSRAYFGVKYLARMKLNNGAYVGSVMWERT